MAKSEQRLEAIQLRKEGKSVKEIAALLGVSRASASIWTRDIELTVEQRDFLTRRQIESGHRGRLMGAEANKRKKSRAIEKAATEAKKISSLAKKDLYFLGLGLFWGEGVKSDKSALAIVNSDPRVILIMISWFSTCFGVPPNRLMPRLYIRDSHKAREEDVIRYWVNYLNIPREQFAKTVFIKGQAKKVYENHNMYYGVIALRVARGTELRYKILAQIERTSMLSKSLV